jgi:hypothetical protein
VDTRQVAERRMLRFAAMREILADAEALDAGGDVRATGNWTPAQIVAHVAELIRLSLDGFTEKAPLPLRLLGPPLIRVMGLQRPWKPGIKVPKPFATLSPPPELAWEEALTALRTAIGRVEGGARMTARSPIAGRLAHEQWEQLHCRHAELHFSFLRTPDT